VSAIITTEDPIEAFLNCLLKDVDRREGDKKKIEDGRYGGRSGDVEGESKKEVKQNRGKSTNSKSSSVM